MELSLEGTEADCFRRWWWGGVKGKGKGRAGGGGGGGGEYEMVAAEEGGLGAGEQGRV